MSRVQKVLLYGALVLLAAFFLFPFYWLLNGSLKSRECMSMTPPSYYPCKVRTISVQVPARQRLVKAEGEVWLRLCSSRNLLDPTAQEGGYYVRLDNYQPTSMASWFADVEVTAIAPATDYIDFPACSIHEFSDRKQLAVVAKLVRRQDEGFDEILLTAAATGGALEVVEPLLNVKHREIRDFDAQWSNYPTTLKGPEAAIGQKSTGFLVFMRNSFFISVMAVIGQLFSSSLVAYGFARLNFRGRDIWFILLLATMMIPGQVTMIPLFAIYKSLGWIDTFLPLIVPHFTAGAFNVFLIRQYMLTLPRELDESAVIDGCGAFRRYLHIILPNCLPVLIVVSLFTFVYTWQDVMGPLIYLDNPAYRTVTLGLEFFRSPYADNRHLLMTGAVLAMLPVFVLFVFLQRHIMSGIATTGLKG